MTPQELKNSILQLAIQGKLVEQRPEEGTAEELFAQIQEEKQRLIAEKKIKKEKPLPEITEDEKPFDIPESWKWVRLVELGSFSSGKTPDMTNRLFWENGTVNWMTSKDMKEKFLSESQMKVTAAAAQEMTVYEAGTLLMVVRSGILKRMLPLCILTQQSTINQDLKAYSLFCSEMSKYVYYMLKALEPSILFNYTKRVTTVDSLKFDEFSRQMLVPLPPLAEQKRIVAKIEELLPYIDRYEQAWSKLEQFNSRFPEDMKKSLLQYAIQGKLVEQRPEEGTAEELFVQIQEEKQRLIRDKKIKKEKPLPEINDDEKPFDIPDSWKWVRVREITCLNPKNNLSDELEVSFIPMALVDDGYRNNHSFEIKKWGDIKKGFTHFADGDIGIAKITPCFQNRKSVVFCNLKNGYGAGTTELSIVRVINNLLSKEYMLWFFKSAYFIENGMKSFTGTAGQQRIHKDYLANCLFPLPPLAEQKRIVEKLEQLLPLCERLK